MSGHQVQSGRVRISSSQPGLDFRTVQPAVKALHWLRYSRAITNAAGRYIPRPLWNPEALYLVQKCPALDPTVRRYNHFHFFTDPGQGSEIRLIETGVWWSLLIKPSVVAWQSWNTFLPSSHSSAVLSHFSALQGKSVFQKKNLTLRKFGYVLRDPNWTNWKAGISRCSVVLSWSVSTHAAQETKKGVRGSSQSTNTFWNIAYGQIFFYFKDPNFRTFTATVFDMKYGVTICCYHEAYVYKSEAVIFTITFLHSFMPLPCLFNVQHVLHILYPQFQGKSGAN